MSKVISKRRTNNYVKLILSNKEQHLHDMQGHGITERLAHARAKRVRTAPEKEMIKHLLNHHSIILDQSHYVKIERKYWMPIEWHLLGEKLGRNPTELDKADYILARNSPSEEYRYYYFFRYPGKLQITEHPHQPDYD